MRKMTAWILAAAMVSTVLAGCGGQSGTSAAEAETAGAAETGTEAEKAEAETEAGEAGSPKEGEESRTEAPEAETVAPGADKTIAVTYVKSPLNVPSIVEKDQKIFEEAFAPLGYTVSYSDLTTGPEQTQALASGDIQFLYAVGATSVILSASNGADIKIISTYSRSPEAFKLFSADDSIQSPEDLRGRTVAGPKGTILHELLVAYLASAGMTEADIDFLAMDIPSSQAALAGGSVDAALLAGPTAYNMEKDGFHIVTDGTGLTEATIVVATSGAYAEEHPEEVKTFLAAQKQVLDYIEANEDAAMEATAVETELTTDAVKEMYPMYDFDMTIRDSDITAMEKTEDFMMENGMIENEVDIQDLILTVE